jgi:hypothetical protein
MLYWLGSLFKKQSLKHQGINVHLQMFCICCFVPIAILAFKEQWWAFGKYLSYVMPYFLLLLFVSLLTDDDWKISITLKKLFFILAGIVLAGNTFFAFTRLISAFDKNGIGHDPTTYPSANGSIKLMNKFNLDISNLDKKKVVNIIVDDDFLHNYVKQKLTYADVPYYHSEPKKTYFGGNDSYYPSIPKPDNMCQRIILEKNSMGINEFKTHNCEESVRLDYPKEKKLK